MNEEIEEWLNRQHAWVQVAAHRLLTSGSITDESIDEFVAIIKNPKPPTAPPQPYPKINASRNYHIRWTIARTYCARLPLAFLLCLLRLFAANPRRLSVAHR